MSTLTKTLRALSVFLVSQGMGRNILAAGTPMKFALLLPLLMMTGCGQREAALRQKIAGTWELTNGQGVITIAPDGSLLSRFTGSTQSWTYEGRWQIKNDQIVITTTKSNSIPCSDVIGCRIIRADGHELIYETSGHTISFSRK